MLKKIIQYTCIVVLLSFISKESRASHIAGGELTYQCLGGDQYQVNLNLFVDCLGFNPGASQFINCTSTCGGTASVTVNVSAATTNGLEISQLCPAQLPLSTCNGGTLPGMWLFSYTGVVTLTPPCDTWTMSWSTCCRNSAITNLSTASSNYYIEATLNSATAACNSSPSFTAQPIPYVCSGQTVNYSYGVVETDGDSLYYSLISALDNVGVNSTYNAGYSGTSPIPGITIDPNTGLVTFTPTTLGNFVVVILVQEYDSNGNLVGSVMRDIQFVVQTCTNVVPSPTGGGITSFSGNAVQTGPYAIEMCAGNNFSFSASYTDADASNVLTYISNIAAALPGAVVTSSGTNPLVLNISWNAPPSMMGQNLTFSMTISDGACPITGQQTFVYSVDILDATTINPDVTICGTQTAQLNAYGGSIFTWSVVSGPPITAANFSCNPCANPIASPVSTTTYAVVSDLSGTCDNVDTVTVFVVPTFTYAITQSSTNSCLMDPVQLSVNSMSPAGAYTYQWTPSTYLSDPTIANPTATFISPGTYTYTVTITSSMGCVQSSTFTIVAAPAFSPVITALGDTTLCAGGIVSLGASFGGSSVPATCGPSTTGGCGGAAFINTVGSGVAVNSTTSYPAPYGNWYTTVKQQYLYTAAELNAAGITGGKIDQLDFNITTIAGITTYHNVTISIGCTNLTTFAASPTAFETGLLNVFNAPTYNITTGWNTHPFATAFQWDGLSNVIVEICFNELNPGANYTSNSSSTNTTTTNLSSIVSLSDSQDQCAAGTPAFIQSFSAHPNIQFHYCSVVPNPANYTYSWTPGLSGVVADSTAQNTTAQPPVSLSYYVTVTDIAGGCSDVDTVNVTVLPFSGVPPFISYVPNHCSSDTAFNLTVNDVGGTWTGTGITDDSLGTFDPSVAGAGTYIITYNSPGSCNGSDTVLVTVASGSNATITQPSPVCAGTSAFNLTAASGGGTWSGTGITDATLGTFDPSTAGSYVVTYSFGGLCPSQDTVTVTVNSVSVPTTGFSYPTSPVCIAGTDPSPSGVASFTTGGVYSSSPFGLTMNSSTGTPDLSTSSAGTYTVTYTVAATTCGPAGTSTTTLIIDPLSTPITNFSYNNTPVCATDTNETPTPVTGFVAGGTYSSGSGLSINDSTGVINVTGSTPGTYTVSYSVPINADSCVAAGTSTTVFTITPLPNIGISSDQLMYIGDNATLYATGGTTYSWTPSDFMCVNSTCDTINVSPSETTDYCVTVNQLGCIDSACLKVVIEIPCISNRDLVVPNAFTPNGDNINDELCLLGWHDCVKSFSIMIYDRWGEKVFESTEPEFCWDGIYKGKQLDPAVFVYFIKASYDTEGATIKDPKKVIQITKTGNISLVR